MKKIYFLLIICLFACKKIVAPYAEDVEPRSKTNLISAVDISSLPEIESNNIAFFNNDSIETHVLDIFKTNGVNTVRLRLWVYPSNGSSGLGEVYNFSQKLKSKGFKIWLSLHYSNTWADPGQQNMPNEWLGLSFERLKDTVYNYTQRVVALINPDIVQIGNEVNSGFLHPAGNIMGSSTSFKSLMAQGIKAVRDHSSETKIMIHFAGISNSDWFFNEVSSLDYDLIGLSFYPVWHGKDLDLLKNKLTQLSQTHDKDILIAETAYPFTLAWNDWTNNIVGLQNQLILPNYPASPTGQQDFIAAIKKMLIIDVPRGMGFCYWGAELVAWKGKQSSDASPWENQALFNFNNRALPALKVFDLNQ